MFQMLNIFLFIIPLLAAAAEDYYQLLGVKKVAKWTDHYNFPKLLFNRWIVPFSLCGIAGKSQSMHFMSATCSIVQQPLTHLMPTTERQENANLDLENQICKDLWKSFFFCPLRMPTTGRFERLSRSWLWSCTRTKTTPRLNFWRFKFQFWKTLRSHGVLWF